MTQEKTVADILREDDQNSTYRVLWATYSDLDLDIAAYHADLLKVDPALAAHLMDRRTKEEPQLRVAMEARRSETRAKLERINRQREEMRIRQESCAEYESAYREYWCARSVCVKKIQEMAVRLQWDVIYPMSRLKCTVLMVGSRKEPHYLYTTGQNERGFYTVIDAIKRQTREVKVLDILEVYPEISYTSGLNREQTCFQCSYEIDWIDFDVTLFFPPDLFFYPKRAKIESIFYRRVRYYRKCAPSKDRLIAAGKKIDERLAKAIELRVKK